MPQGDEDLVETLSDVRDLLQEIAPILRDVGYLVDALSASRTRTANMPPVGSNFTRPLPITSPTTETGQQEAMQTQNKDA